MVSHIVGGAVGIAGLVLCVIISAFHKNPWAVVGSSIYGASMIILYTMSSIYHGLSPKLTAKKVFQIIDHCSIFLLIAGTYTPIALTGLREYNAVLGWTVFGVVWFAAVLGIVLNSIDIKAFKTFSAVCYLIMGWCIVFAWKPTAAVLTKGGVIFWLPAVCAIQSVRCFIISLRKKGTCIPYSTFLCCSEAFCTCFVLCFM